MTATWLRAAGLGLVASSALVWARWWTAEPVNAIALRYDVACGALLFAGVGGLLAAGRARRSSGWAIPLAVGVLAALWWAAPSVAKPAGLRLVTPAAAALVAGWALWRWLRGTPGRVPEALALLSLGVGFGLSFAGPRWLALAFPGAAALVVGLGVRAGSGAGIAVAALATVVAATFADAVPPPGSGMRPPTRIARATVPGPGVLLIVLDTVRADHLTVYGYERPTSPELARFSEAAMVFDRARADGSWTLPSHGSMFTGLPPRSHGARRHNDGADEVRPLADDVETLAEILAARGVATGGIVANHYYLSERFRLHRGFDTWWVPQPRRGFAVRPLEETVKDWHPHAWRAARSPYHRAPRITNAALAWLDARGPDDAFFLFVNYMDAHRPTDRPETPSFPDSGVSLQDAGFKMDRALAGATLPPDVATYLMNHYDRALATLDAELGRLFRELDARGRLDRTTVIVTSDHGEYFGEHGYIDHGRHVHLPVTAIPLLIRGHGITPGRSSALVQLSDVFPTVLERFGIRGHERPDTSSLLAPGRPESVSEWHTGGDVGDAELEERLYDRDVRAIETNGHRLYVTSRGDVEFYDLREDPGEANDVSGEFPGRVSRLRERLAAWERRHPPRTAEGAAAVEPLDPELREQLRELGYTE